MKVDFFIVGAPKAGTTSLYYYLNEHPEIVMSSQKETDFFSDESLQKQGLYYGKNRISTMEQYHALFENYENKVVGEASVSYLFYEDVPKKIKAYNASAKIIVMLRNPADRAFSHYLMDYRLGLINQSFASVLAEADKGRKQQLFYQQFVRLGLYYEQLKRYFETFGKENVHIIFYDDFKNDLQNQVQKTYDFLEVDSTFVAQLNTKHNTFSMPKSSWARNVYAFVQLRRLLRKILPNQIVKQIKVILFSKTDKPVLSDKLRLQLNELYADDIKELAILLNRDLSQWTK